MPSNKKQIKQTIQNGKNIKDVVLKLKERNILEFYDLLLILNDRLLCYTYKGEKLFSYAWAQLNKKYEMWVTFRTKNNTLHGKTYFMLALLFGEYKKVADVLRSNFGKRGGDVYNIIGELAALVQETVYKVLSKSYDLYHI